MESQVSRDEDTMTSYKLLSEQLQSLTGTEPEPLPNLCNAAALLYETLPDINWAGFYFVMPGESGEELVLGPFEGRTACIRIRKGHGVCGTAWELGETLTVPDVHKFPGHIACDAASASEIVIPLHALNGNIVGVLDIDSPLVSRFSDEDRAGLEEYASGIEKWCLYKKPPV